MGRREKVARRLVLGAVVRGAVLSLCIGLAGAAPLQCQSDPDPATRRYETPPEALYELAGRFKRRGNDEAWRETLSYLRERYPNSREAVMAADDLEKEHGDH